MNPFTTVKKGSEAMLLMSTLKRRLNSAIDIVISDLTLDGEVPRKNLVRYTIMNFAWIKKHYLYY